MIISRAPVRLPLGGGGTDLPVYFNSRGGGSLITCAIDKYVYILVRDNFEKGIRFTGYHNKEVVDHYSKLNNRLVKAVLQFLDFSADVEIVSMSDVRSSCGLGTSSSFVVALIKGLYKFKGLDILPREVAEIAVKVERDVLNEAGGVQDQYVAAFGGLIRLDIERGRKVSISEIPVSRERLSNIFDCIGFFDTRIERDSFTIQDRVIKRIEKYEDQLRHLDEVKDLGVAAESFLLKEDVIGFGSTIREHWKNKCIYTGSIEPAVGQLIEQIDIYGALGSKLMGAGGGGIVLSVFANSDDRKRAEVGLRENGIKVLRFKPSYEGAELLSVGGE